MIAAMVGAVNRISVRLYYVCIAEVAIFIAGFALTFWAQRDQASSSASQ